MSRTVLHSPAFRAALAVMALAAIGMQSAISHYQIYLRKKAIFAEPIPGPDGTPAARVLRAIPTETEHFVRAGQDHIESEETLETLGTDNYLTRQYVEKEPGPSGKRRLIQLHVAYYTGMIDTVPHVPERCLTGGGWALVREVGELPVPLQTGDWRPPADLPPDLEGRLYTTRLSNEYSTAGRGMRVTLPRDLTPTKPLALRVSEFAAGNGPHLYAGYFFIANGGWVSRAEGVRFLAFDLTTDYAYYLKVQVGSTDVSSPEELASLGGALLDDLLGEIMTCVPDWTRVQAHLWPPDNSGAARTPAAPHP